MDQWDCKNNFKYYNTYFWKILQMLFEIFSKNKHIPAGTTVRRCDCGAVDVRRKRDDVGERRCWLADGGGAPPVSARLVASVTDGGGATPISAKR
nr:hypothetical protein Itr_chr14CG05600 [Ipomoea trifida]